MNYSSTILFSLVAVALSACATAPPATGYVEAPSETEFGYRIKEVEPEAFYVGYNGNNRTNSTDALAYTVVAGIEHCHKLGQYGYVAKPEEITQTETHTNVGSYSLPMPNGYGGTTYTTQVYSYPVTSTYPGFYTVAFCRKSFKDLTARAEFEAIGRELVHNVTKDFRGGLLVKSVKDDEHTLKADDVLIRVGNERIQTIQDLNRALEKMPEGRIGAEIIRKQNIVPVTLVAVDLTQVVKDQEEAQLDLLCPKISKVDVEPTWGEERPLGYPAICAARVKH